MNDRRLITSSILKLHGFKYDEVSKMWIKRYDLHNAYVTVTYKYDWNERKLYLRPVTLILGGQEVNGNTTLK